MESSWVSDIAAACLDFERWPPVLEALAKECGAKGGVLHVHSASRRRWTASPSIRDMFARYLDKKWPENSDRVSRGIRLQHPGFLTDLDLYTPGDLAVMPVYTKFLVPEGMIGTAGTHIGGAVDGQLVLTVWGFPTHDAAKASVPFLNTLRPELARSCMLAAESERRQTRTAVAALATTKQAAALVGEGRLVLARNDLFRNMLPEFGFECPIKGLRVSDREADERLGKDLDAVEKGGGSIAVRLPGDGRGVIHVLPSPDDISDISTGARAIVVYRRVEKDLALNMPLVSCIYDFTPKHAELVEDLVAGLSLAESAVRRGISLSTAKKRLNKLFERTNTNTQAHLLALLCQHRKL